MPNCTTQMIRSQKSQLAHLFATLTLAAVGLVALAQVRELLPKGIEGGSLAAVLTHAGKGTVARPREEFVVHFPH